MKTSLWQLGLFSLMVLLGWGQVQPQKNAVTSSLEDLRSDDVGVRYEAYQRLKSDPVALRSATVRAALLELLEREYREFDSRVREAQATNRETVVQNSSEDEGWAEYRGDLMSIVASFADLRDKNQICVLVKAGYLPASQSTSENALRLRTAMPCLAPMAESSFPLDRLRADSIFVKTLAQSRGALDENTRQAVQRNVMRALHDPDESVRSETVRALERFGAEDMVPALEEVAASDPAISNTSHDYWLRKDALRAIAAIQQRAGQN